MAEKNFEMQRKKADGTFDIYYPKFNWNNGVNKPVSMPANGGNADTANNSIMVGGYTAAQLRTGVKRDVNGAVIFDSVATATNNTSVSVPATEAYVDSGKDISINLDGVSFLKIAWTWHLTSRNDSYDLCNIEIRDDATGIAIVSFYDTDLIVAGENEIATFDLRGRGWTGNRTFSVYLQNQQYGPGVTQTNLSIYKNATYNGGF